MHIVGTMPNGAHVIIHPLLVLTADQILAFLKGSEVNGTMVVHNFDEVAVCYKLFQKKLIAWILNLQKHKRQYLLYRSLQLFALYNNFVISLLKCNKRKMLCSVSVENSCIPPTQM